MTASRTVYTARFQAPDRIEQNASWTVACPVYYEAALVVPSAGTCTVYNANGDTVKTGAVSVVSSVAELTIDAADTVSEDLGERWRIEWELTLPGPVTFTTRNTAALVLMTLSPVICDEDLFRRSSALDYGNADRVITDVTDYQSFREEAWIWLDAKLVAKGRRPQLIMSSTDLRDVHILKTLELIYRDLSQRNADAYLDTASDYGTDATAAFNSLAFIYDGDEDGQADSDKRKPAVGSVWLNGRATGIGGFYGY